MTMKNDYFRNVLDHSVQINDGLTQTSADGPCLVFDKKYGIMFCSYMPGLQGHYGESRGKISLSYFPASQPTNIRFVDIAVGNDEYCPTCLSLGCAILAYDVVYDRSLFQSLNFTLKESL